MTTVYCYVVSSNIEHICLMGWGWILWGCGGDGVATSGDGVGMGSKLMGMGWGRKHFCGDGADVQYLVTL